MKQRKLRAAAVMFTAVFLLAICASALEWRTSWASSAQGPYPSGNPTAQPELDKVFPKPEQGAVDQCFRNLMRPDIWGESARVRFTNVFGSKPLTIDGAYLGLHLSGAAVVEGTNQPITFDGKPIVTIPPGEDVWSDAVSLPYYKELGSKFLFGRKLAVSFHVVGESGPMTWHAKALNTSYISRPHAGSVGGETSEVSFPYSSTSWYLVDAVDMMADADTRVIVAFGDSITDGTNSTLNGEDRWPDAFSRLVHAAYGDKVSVVNAGIGGNQVVWPKVYTAEKPYRGGPASGIRIDRDVLSLSGVSAVIWLEGINDFSNLIRTSEEVQEEMRAVVQYIKKKAPGVRVIGATLPTALGSKIGTHGDAIQDEKRLALNEFIRNSGVFDGFVDFAAATLDPGTNQLRAEFVPGSTTGGPGDWLHPNRAGYIEMAKSIDMQVVLPKK